MYQSITKNKLTAFILLCNIGLISGCSSVNESNNENLDVQYAYQQETMVCDENGENCIVSYEDANALIEEPTSEEEVIEESVIDTPVDQSMAEQMIAPIEENIDMPFDESVDTPLEEPYANQEMQDMAFLTDTTIANTTPDEDESYSVNEKMAEKEVIAAQQAEIARQIEEQEYIKLETETQVDTQITQDDLKDITTQNVDENKASETAVDENTDKLAITKADDNNKETEEKEEKAPTLMDNVQYGEEPQDWNAPAGETLRSLLLKWGEQSGWTVIWKLDRDYKLEAGVIFRGTFTEVAKSIIRSFARATPAPVGTFYNGNRVLVINTQENENAN